MRQMLKLSEKDFKLAIIKMPQQEQSWNTKIKTTKTTTKLLDALNNKIKMTEKRVTKH